MQHLFQVHSPLTYAMTRRIMETEQLTAASVVLLVSRQYEPPAGGGLSVVRVPYQHYPVDSFAVQMQFWKNRAKVQEVDRWLEAILQGDDFYWYASHSYSTFFYLLATNARCKGYYFVEEGNLVYTDEQVWQIHKPFNPLRGLLYWFNFGRRNKSDRHFFDVHTRGYLGCYGILEQSFGQLPNKKIVGFPFPAQDLPERYDCILVHDSLYEQYPPQVYLDWVGVMVKDAVRRGFGCLHQKFHPAQKRETIEQIQTHIETLLTGSPTILKTLTVSDSIETIAASQQPTVYLCVSSVGIYAHIGGARVISLFKYCRADHPELERFAAAFPAFYAEGIEYI